MVSEIDGGVGGGCGRVTAITRAVSQRIRAEYEEQRQQYVAGFCFHSGLVDIDKRLERRELVWCGAVIWQNFVKLTSHE